MRILVDLQSLQTDSKYRGIGRYSWCFFKALVKVWQDAEFLVLFNDQERSIGPNNDCLEEINNLISTKNILYFPTPVVINPLRCNDSAVITAATIIRERFIEALTPDIFLTTSLFEFDALTMVPSKQNRSYSTATILYDLIPLNDRSQYLPNTKIKLWYYDKIKSLLRSDIIFPISEFSRQEAIRLIGMSHDCSVSILGASQLINNTELDLNDYFFEKFNISDNFILYVGGYDSRKNVDKLIKAYSMLKEEIKFKYQLVLVGKIKDSDKIELEKLIYELSIEKKRIIFAGYVEDEFLISLYKKCHLFVFPSSDEGFGLPPLEAMTFGAPVIAANRASLIEVINNPESLFDPDDIQQFSSILYRSVVDECFRNILIKHSNIQSKKFSWEQSAKKAIEFISEKIKNKTISTHNDWTSHQLFDSISRCFRKNSNKQDLQTVTELFNKTCRTTKLLLENNVIHKIPGEFDMRTTFKTDVPDFSNIDKPYVFTSTLCREQHFRLPLFTYWCNVLKEIPKFHRKLWEYIFICQVLHERGFISAGNKALGFGVGKEPLVAYFASKNIKITATDLDLNEAKQKGWVSTGQYSANILSLNEKNICDEILFKKNVDFKYVDMNAIPEDIGKYDFCWSACALEHLGSINNGITFIINSLNALKPGGIAVHTTEFNLSSNLITMDNNPGQVLFRKKDIEKLILTLREKECVVEAVDYLAGEDQLERYVDLPPYCDEPHLRLEIANEFVSTSIGLIIRKNFKK